MKKIIAKTIIGKEFMYGKSSAHAVPAASAHRICSALNNARFRLHEHETWHVYDADDFEIETSAASYQKFFARSGRIYESTY